MPTIVARVAVVALLTLATASTALAQSATVSIAKKAALVPGGGAVEVTVTASCSSGDEVLEAFLYVVQGGQQSNLAGIPLTCTGEPQRHVVRVTAPAETTFHRGKASASAFVLVIDPATSQTGSGQATTTLKIK